MAPVRNAKLIYAEIPQGYPIPGQTLIYDSSSEVLDVESIQLKPGEFLVQTLVLSVDPYMRGKMRNPAIQSYSPAYVVGEALYSEGVGVVLRSENGAFKEGDHIIGDLSAQEYKVYTNAKKFKVLNKHEKLAWSAYLGVAGMPGKTAYYGYREFTKAKKGETIYVSSAAGAVGSVVVQLAKADGLKVIASAGTPDKIQFLKDIGADVVFNYKETPLDEVLKEHGPVHIYWDHVGGEMLQTTLNHMAVWGRVVVCGAISQYNSKPFPISNLGLLISKRLTLYGMLVGDLESKYAADFEEHFVPRVESGEIKYVEVSVNGLEKMAGFLVDMLKGTMGLGKGVVIMQEVQGKL